MSIKWTPARIFALSIATGFALAIGLAYWHKQRSLPSIPFKELTRDVLVTSQISLQDISSGRLRGIRSLVDLRPDGEAADQPSASEIAAAIQQTGASFNYIPIPHGAIPDQAVESLRSLLDQPQRPILLYCRSGNRAARTWALSEASGNYGLSAQAIRGAVARAGFSTADIDASIDAHVAARKPR